MVFIVKRDQEKREGEDDETLEREGEGEDPEAQDPQPFSVVLEVNEFDRVTKRVDMMDPEAASHWDVRLWRRLL